MASFLKFRVAPGHILLTTTGPYQEVAEEAAAAARLEVGNTYITTENMNIALAGRQARGQPGQPGQPGVWAKRGQQGQRVHCRVDHAQWSRLRVLVAQEALPGKL
jgi:hypothetical protein